MFDDSPRLHACGTCPRQYQNESLAHECRQSHARNAQ